MPFESDLTPFAARSHAGRPSRFGLRYDETRFLPEAGNTVVCHLDTGDPAHEAVLGARELMMALPGAEGLLFTPVESLHMTLFEGVIETRRGPDAWPADMDREGPVADVTEAMVARLAEFAAPPPFAVRLAGLRPVGLSLRGATTGEAASMTAWREALAEAFGYRHAEHDAYQFHMTFAYVIDWLPDDALPVWEHAVQEIFDELAEAAPVIPLTRPAFCRFADMTRFEQLVVLG